MNSTAPIYKNHRFPIDIVARAVWLYFRFNVSLREVEEMMLERGVAVSYETTRRWCRTHRADYARRLRCKSPSPSDIWHLDELVVRVNGEKCWLWRAVDQDGYVLDEIVQTRRNSKTAKRLLTRLLKKQGMAPKRMVTDKLRSYGAARRQVMPEVEHRSHKASTTGPRIRTCRFESGSEHEKASGRSLHYRNSSQFFSAVRNLFVPSQTNRSATQVRNHQRCRATVHFDRKATATFTRWQQP